MSFRSCASIVLALAVSGCASSGGGEGGSRAVRAPRGTSTLIIRAELERYPGQSAHDVIESLHNRWLRPRRGATFGGGQPYARVMIDGTIRAEIPDLRRLFSENIDTMRLLSAPDATIKYGTGYPGGVIEVTTIRGR